ncbi:MAG: hypothetical protein ACTHU0_36660 [Kofleriaceae bacterium]
MSTDAPAAEAESVAPAEEAEASEPVVAEPEIPGPAGQESGEPDAWDRAILWLEHHGALPALGVLTIAMAAIYAGVFRGELAGDDLTFHMAEASRLADQLAAGDWDFWNVSANGGFASLYYYQAIPQLASAIPAAIFGDFLFWFQLSVFVPHVLVPLAAYRGLRLMGATPWQAFGGALAMAFLTGESRWGASAESTFRVGLYTQTWALAAFPLALGHSARWIAEGKGLAAAIAWSAFCGLCHPFAGISLGIALLATVVVRQVTAAAGGRRGKLVWFVVLLLGLAINLALAVWRVQALYLVPILLFGAGALRIGWELWSPRAPAPVAEAPPWRELVRISVLGACMVAAALPGWLTVVVDYDGFGGFPHRVHDEVGPGYATLMKWQLGGWILDYERPLVLTWSLPVALLLARTRYHRWLWPPALVYAALLALGPHIGKTSDEDLLPPVRFLGTMQVVLALAIGSGLVAIAAQLSNGRPDALVHRAVRGVLARVRPRHRFSFAELQFAVRTAVAAVVSALVVLATVRGGAHISGRVRVLGDNPGNRRAELLEINELLKVQPAGRKQVGPGAENHWWNMLTYVYGRRPSLLQMGGGGLQASPNYDFVYSVREFPKLAWVYDTPYFVFDRSKPEQPAGVTVAETKHYEIRRFPAPGAISAVQVTGVLPPGSKPARAAAIAWLRTDAPMANQVLAYDGHGGPGPAPHATIVRAGRELSAGDRADLFAEVDAAQPSTIMARESWHPRWHAYIDGVAAPIRRVTPDFPAVEVPAGKHLVQFRFERPWWAHAAWLAWPGVVLLAWLAARLRDRARRQHV